MKNIKKSWIDWIQVFLIGLTAPFFLFPSMKYTWIFLVIPGIWICRWIVKKQPFERTVLDWAVIILLIQVFITCIIVPDLSFSLPKIAGVLYGVALFYSIVSLLDSEKLIKWGIVGFLVAGLLFSIICILGIKWDKEIFFSKMVQTVEKIIPKIKWNLPGAEEGFNSNAIGGVLILFIPLCLVLFASYLKRQEGNYSISNRLMFPIFLSIISFILISVLFFTLSFGSWLALISSIWILLLPWKWKKWSLLVLLPFLLITFIYILATNKTDINIQSRNKKVLADNKPYTIASRDLIQNGEFEADIAGWSQRASALLASVNGGQTGNCLQIKEGGAATPYTLQYLPITAGKFYKFSFYVKKGTESSYFVRLYDMRNSSNILKRTSKYAGANWEHYTYVFKAPDGCNKVQILLQSRTSRGSGKDIYFDGISLYEIEPNRIRTDDKSFYRWVKDIGLEYHRKQITRAAIYSIKNTIEDRTFLWSVGINTISKHPFFGIGMNRIRQLPSVSYEKSHVHNLPLHTGAELGIPGLMAYLAILIGTAYMCIKIWRKSNVGWIQRTAMGLGCGQLAHFIFGLADSIPLGAKVGIFFWFSLGLIASLYNYTIRKSIEFNDVK